MMVVKTMSGKLLCSLGMHKMITQIARNQRFPLIEVEVRKCVRCGFGYRTGKVVRL